MRVRQGVVAWRSVSAAGEGAFLLRYRLENGSSRPLPALFAAHPLLAVSRASRLVLPPEVKALRQRVPLLPDPAPWLAWPQGDDERLDTDLQPDLGTRRKLFTAPLQAGWAVLFHPDIGEGLAFHFLHTVLPYLGIWRAQGVYLPGRAHPVYCLGLEPTNWPWETPLEGEGTGPVLGPGQALTFSLGVQLLRAPDYAGDGPPPFPVSLQHGG